MVSFPGFGHPHHEFSQTPEWVLMFLAGKPAQTVHSFSSPPWAGQLQLLHAVPSVPGAVCAVPGSLHDAGCAVGAVPAALSAPGNVGMLLFVPSQWLCLQQSEVTNLGLACHPPLFGAAGPCPVWSFLQFWYFASH